MANDKRVGTKLPGFVDKARAPGQRFDPGPYIGIVKRTVDSTRTGRIQVYIPELGGNNPESEANWFTVAYASPFGGATRNPSVNTSNQFGQTANSYGFWMIPPDIGNEVLVTFVSGDPGRGFWFACVNSDLSQHMVPAIGSSDKVDLAVTPQNIANILKPGNRYPVAEFNTHNEASYNQAFYANPKPLHLPQFIRLVSQGLQDDPVRGTIGSSAQRETPSAVFGISTPGRAYGLDPEDDPALLQKIANANVDLGDLRATVRKGGHTFVMDDGSIKGEDRLVRLRTAAGHQILMHDTEQTIYIGHSNGGTWLELTKDGQVLIYATKGFSVRSVGPMNFHSDTVINFNAKSAIRMSAGRGIVAETEGGISLTGKQGVNLTGMSIGCKADVSFSASAATTSITGLGLLTCKAAGKAVFSGAATTLSGAIVNIMGGKGGGIATAGVSGASFAASRLFGGSGIQKLSLPDTKQNSEGIWETQPGALKSIVTVAPTHEPYNRTTVAEIAAIDTDASGNPIYATEAGEAIGPNSARGSGAGSDRQAPVSSFIGQPDPPGGIGNLDQTEVKAYMAQMGYSEGSGQYNIRGGSGNNYLGKYQLGAAALEDLGYLKKGSFKAYGNDAVNNPDNWLGTNGVGSAQDFMKNSALQDIAMYNYTSMNYDRLIKSGVITSQSSNDNVAGILGVSHLLGSAGAKEWYNGNGGKDAFGTTGNTYYNLGRYSQQVLLAQGTGKTTTG